jgi:HlyD family secretion protein
MSDPKITADLSRLRIDRGPAGGQPVVRPRWTRYIVIVIVVVGVAAFAWKKLNAPPPVDVVNVTSAWPSQHYALLNASGYVVPQRNAALSSKGQGRLEWLGVLEGSHVKTNEIIARLESRDVRASLEQATAQVGVASANLTQAEAEVRDAEANLRRSTELLAKQFISGAQQDTNIARVDKARAAVASARASVASAEANRRVAEVAVEQTLIRAPFDGVVLTKNANVGDNITPFSAAVNSKGAVVTLADMNTLEVEADVSESSIAKITANQPVEIQLDALPELRLAGTVSRIVPTVDRSKATVMVKVKFVERDPRVLPDMSAKVAFLSKAVPDNERKPVVAVQGGAIVERNGKPVVFALNAQNDGHVRMIAVKPGAKVGELVQIDNAEASGLKVGDKLVAKPDAKLQDGAAVSVAIAALKK